MKKIAILFLATIAVLVIGCSNKPQPETTFTSYIQAWEKKQYGEMYEHISKESKQAISKSEFIERYESIYQGIEMKGLQLSYTLPEEDMSYKKEDSPSFDYEGSMETLGGKISFSHASSLVYEEGEDQDKWSISWSPDMIFPSMEKGDVVKAESEAPNRGQLYDKNGKGLAVNGEVVEVGLVPQWMKEDKEEVKQTLSKLLNMSVEDINSKLNQSWVKENSFVPLTSIPRDSEELIEKIRPLNGTKMPTKPARVYPQGKAAAHLTGYVGPITAEQLKEWKDKGYTKNSVVGKAGLELLLEDKLKGSPGGKVYIETKEGEQKKTLAKQNPVNGEDVTLTIDASIQKAIYKQMAQDAGSAAAINPMTGTVEALVSSPAYDPNSFILGMNNNQYNALKSNPKKPLTNRFRQSYAPGSTFKPITAAIGLESNAISPSEEVSIHGRSFSKDGWGDYSVNRVESASSDNAVNLTEALYRSDNIYFAKAILSVGESSFLKGAKPFGFAEDIPFPYTITSSQITGENGFQNEIQLADTGYGQGEVEMSTLHLALSYTPFITEGTLLEPVLMKKDETNKAWHQNVISKDTAAIIKQGLTEVVTNPSGTAYNPQVEGISLAGKTGTAELKTEQGEQGKENGWFVAWDTGSSDLLVSMMIEDVREKGGSHYTVEKVKEVFKEISSN